MKLTEIVNSRGNAIRDFIDQTYYVFDENRDKVVIEEAKRKYTITFGDAYLLVSPHYDTGATDERADEIKNEIIAATS